MIPTESDDEDDHTDLDNVDNERRGEKQHSSSYSHLYFLVLFSTPLKVSYN